MHRTPLRLLQAAFLAIGVSMVPLATVSACSCAMQELPEAIASADVAFVGTVSSFEQATDAQLGERLSTTWQVTSSRDPLPTASITVGSVKDDGANCGISFGVREEWLVLAYRSEGGLETNGCTMSRPLGGDDPEAEALIAEAMQPVTASADVEEPALPVPVPVIGLGAAALVIGIVSLLAFRRSSR
jgi:hypothetical protein